MAAVPLRITIEHLESFAIGAWIMGTGGGGEPYFSLLEARQHWAEGKSVELIDPMSLDDDDLIACVGQMGAPIAMQEKMCDGPVIAATIPMMEKHIGRKFKAIMLWEVGGNNGFQAFLAGAILGLPVVDCDAMGRAFPQADMTTFAISDFPAAPWTMIDIRRNSVIFTEAVDWSWMERMTRKVCTVFGSVSGDLQGASHRPRGEDGRLPAYRDQGTPDRPRCASGAQGACRSNRGSARLREGKLLFRGKVKDVMRRATEGWLRGTVNIEGLDENRGETFRLDFQNEWSVGWQNDEVTVTVPDLICVMDTVSGEAIGTETIRYGQRVDRVPCRRRPF